MNTAPTRIMWLTYRTPSSMALEGRPIELEASLSPGLRALSRVRAGRGCWFCWKGAFRPIFMVRKQARFIAFLLRHHIVALGILTHLEVWLWCMVCYDAVRNDESSAFTKRRNGLPFLRLESPGDYKYITKSQKHTISALCIW